MLALAYSLRWDEKRRCKLRDGKCSVLSTLHASSSILIPAQRLLLLQMVRGLVRNYLWAEQMSVCLCVSVISSG